MEFHSRQGPNNAKCKLTVEQVYEIKKLISEGMPAKEIGKKFNIHRTTVHAIKHGVSWNYLPDQE